MVKNMSWEEIRLLRKYWNECGFGLCKPFRYTTKKEKIAVYQTLGYQKYALAMALQELIKVIKEEVYQICPKWLWNLFKDDVN